MTGRCKKLVTDLGRGSELEKNIKEYGELLGSQYHYYAIVKMCLNYYTMKEIIWEQEDKNTDACKYFSLVSKLVEEHIVGEVKVTEEALTAIRQLRDNVEYKMHILTAFTDGFEVYEYILNRIEAKVTECVEEIDIDKLSKDMFSYVFSENDTVVINSKLQLLMAQLPVRMTKNKFYDVVSNTLSIYKGGERSSLDDFADMLRTAVLLKKPKGFETEYPYLYHVYTDLKQADYKTLDGEAFHALNDSLSEAAAIINNEASVYLLLQEIINDVYALLLTREFGKVSAKLSGYQAAKTILSACLDRENIEELPELLMDSFLMIEGVQENVYENIMILESAFVDVREGQKELIEKLALSEQFSNLSIVEKLLASSLFIDLDKQSDGNAETADGDYISKIKEELTEEFAGLFAENDRMVNRSIMCKILASMPIFLNSQQEIKDYFDYVLNNCKDESELTACSKLVYELMQD